MPDQKLTKEQIEAIKNQLYSQIDSIMPLDQRVAAKEQVRNMSEEELMQFLKTNARGASQDGKCIFCQIAEGKAESFKIAGNKAAVAVLEINPISQGHTLIIPKIHKLPSEKISENIKDLTKVVTQKIKKELNPKDLIIKKANLFGHTIINILPVYSNETLDSQKTKAEPEKLKELQKKLFLETAKKFPKVRKTKPKKIKNKFWILKRIP